MKRVSAILLAAASGSSAPRAALALQWRLDNLMCDGDPFADVDVAVLCDGSSSCTFGDTATVSGRLTATSSFEDSNVTVIPCGVDMCFDTYAADAGALCDWLVPADDCCSACGRPGEYEVRGEFDVPSANEMPRGSMSWMTVVVSVKIEIGRDEEECEGSVGTTSGYREMGSSYVIAGGSAGGGANWGESHPIRSMLTCLALSALVAVVAIHSFRCAACEHEDETLGEEATIVSGYAREADDAPVCARGGKHCASLE